MPLKTLTLTDNQWAEYVLTALQGYEFGNETSADLISAINARIDEAGDITISHSAMSLVRPALEAYRNALQQFQGYRETMARIEAQQTA